VNNSPDKRKTEKKSKAKAATDKGKEEVSSKKEGTGMGGVQLGTQSDEKPLKRRKTPREVRDLG